MIESNESDMNNQLLVPFWIVRFNLIIFVSVLSFQRYKIADNNVSPSLSRSDILFERTAPKLQRNIDAINFIQGEIINLEKQVRIK
jgi:hypothetical protein